MLSRRNWERHANPWSVWTRVASFPFFAAALWSPYWIGWWSLLPLVLITVWLWLNPRLFPPPPTLESWAAQVTLGERCWIAQTTTELPGHHRIPLFSLYGVMGLGLILWTSGLIIQHGWLYILGSLLAFIGKVWFCDRMVWLYRDMKQSDTLPDDLRPAE